MVAADRQGNGLHRSRPHIAGDQSGSGVNKVNNLLPWFAALAQRLRRVRICCGDWRRVVTPAVLDGSGMTGIVLDPPYSHQERDGRLYGEDTDIAHQVASWAREHGNNPKYRLVLCGYEGEHEMPGWTLYRWQANGGYGNQGNGRGKTNRQRECLWFSPHCETVTNQLAFW